MSSLNTHDNHHYCYLQTKLTIILTVTANACRVQSMALGQVSGYIWSWEVTDNWILPSLPMNQKNEGIDCY